MAKESHKLGPKCVFHIKSVETELHIMHPVLSCSKIHLHRIL